MPPDPAHAHALASFSPLSPQHTGSSLLSTFSSSVPAPTRSRSRSSTLLGAASDALSARFRRRKKSSASAYPGAAHSGAFLAPHAHGAGVGLGMGMVLSEVIEIAPPRAVRKEEDEERERLRAAAAQSIGVPAGGLGAFDRASGMGMGAAGLQDATSFVGSIDETEEDAYGDEEAYHERSDGYGHADRNSPTAAGFVTTEDEDASTSFTHNNNHALMLPRHPFAALPTPPASSASVSASAGTSSAAGRMRSGSRATVHTPPPPLPLSTAPPSALQQLHPIPRFPTTPAQLAPHARLAGMLPKHHAPASSLLPFSLSLSKQWRLRYVVLSAPLPAGAAPAYLHLFRHAGAEERELERLEVDAASVVFVAEEEVGGRRGVVKVGGVPVDGGTVASRKERERDKEEGEGGGRAMWLLQIVDQNESQSWIDAIKNAVLSQR
jgi:hypothetical protein